LPCVPAKVTSGTTIRTAAGDRKIEELAVGDLLPTVFGGTCAIQWIGYYPYKRRDPAEPWVKHAPPVRVAHSALGPNTPHADLYVTKEHALLIDGVLDRRTPKAIATLTSPR
jgi:hypothetical protein